MTNRVEIVREIQNLLIKTDRCDVVVKYGYEDKDGFHESETDINMDPDKHEVVLIKYENQSDKYGRLQSIEGDGLFWIIFDVIKKVNQL